MANPLNFQATLDASDVFEKLRRIQQELDAASGKLASRSYTSEQLGPISDVFGRDFKEKLRGAQSEVKRIRAEMRALQKESSIWPNRFDRDALRLPGLMGAEGTGATLERERLALTQQLVTAEQQVANLRRQARAQIAGPEQKSLVVAQERLMVERQIRDITSGSFKSNLVTGRLREIDEATNRLMELKTALQEGSISGLQERTRNRISTVAVKSSQELRKAEQDIARILTEQLATERRLGTAIAANNKQAIERLSLKSLELKHEMQIAQQRKIAAAEKVKDATTRQAGYDELSGAAKDVREIELALARLAALRKQLEAGVLGDEKDLNQLDQYRQRLQKINAALEAGNLSAQKANRYRLEQAELLKRIPAIMARVQTQGIPGIDNIQGIAEGAERSLTRAQRIFAGAMDGFQRRFEATLQFAISGAIIFGAQRMVREFVQAAIEVERAFKDIETALEFDVPFERGTGEFNKVVSDIRRDVLSIANEFNVLPTEANKAAFVMVARFNDMDNAMKAFRAQILATKVSTIDQSEVLRALTAVAEGFAAALFESVEGLTVHEKLLRREAIAANLYAQALDLAVFIQQKFGVETEDVLEGTARATEVFRQMGFTMTETAALVSAVSRQLGQTGQQSAERLVRSIGQLSSPQIRDQLLDLAASTDALALSYADFASGASAWEAIANQFERLERLDPRAAQELLQIVGQRREAEAVAAALGTVALQTEIITSSIAATGAAERRFKFLQQTVAETIQSILAEFQSLAQNVERLGLLTPMKVLLSGVNGVLEVVNSLVQAVESLINAIDRVPVIGDIISSDTLKTILSIAIAARTLKAAVIAISAGAAKRIGTAALAGGGGVGPVGSEAIAGAAGAAVLAAAPLKKAFNDLVLAVSKQQTTYRTLLGTMGALIVAIGREIQARLLSAATSLHTRALTSGNAAIRALSAAGSKAALALGKISPAALGATAGALGAVAFTAWTVVSAFKGAERAAEAMSTAQLDARQRAQSEALAEDLTPAQEARRRSQYELENLTAESEEGIGSYRSWFIETFDSWFRETSDEFDNALKQRAEAGLQPLSLGELYRLAKYDPSTHTKNTKLWWEAVTHQARQQWLKDSVKALQEEAANIGTLPTSGTGPGPSRALFDAQTQLAALQNQLGAALTEEEQASIAEKIAEVELRIRSLGGLAADALEGIEGSVSEIMEELGRTQTKLRTGETTLPDAIKFFRDKIAGLQAIETDDPEVQKLIEDGIRQYVLGLQELLNQSTERAFSVMEATAPAQFQAGLKVMQAKAYLDKQIKDTQEWWDAFVEYRKAQNEAAEYLSSLRIDTLQSQMGLARHSEDWFELADRLLPMLFSQSNKYTDPRYLDEEKALQYAVEYWTLFWEVQDRKLEEAQRLLIAQAKLAGPVGNKLNDLNAQIKATEAALATDLDDLIRQETLVRLRELIAEKNREEFNIWAAQVRAIAGVNDSITNLNAELTIVGQEMELVAKTVGKNSAEWHNLQLAQERLEYELASAELELQVIAAKLDSDLTDPLAQAEINLAEVIAKLANPDLGEVERARLELEKANAENAREQAYFNNELFNLRFLSETGQIGTAAYISSLQALLAQVDTSTQQGREIFLQIQSIIDGLTSDISNMQFNVPGSIRLPTLFEVRRALEADSLGVNYMDNRTQQFTFYVSETIDLDTVVDIVNGPAVNRSAPGSATLTLGGQF